MFQVWSRQQQCPDVGLVLLFPTSQEGFPGGGNTLLPAPEEPWEASLEFFLFGTLFLEGSQDVQALLQGLLLPVTHLVLLNQLGDPGHL